MCIIMKTIRGRGKDRESKLVKESNPLLGKNLGFI